MTRPGGLRERKRQQTQEAICDAATTLMLDRGFAGVSIADVAAAAGVSKVTVFNYFAAKEDLILCQIADHVDDAARVVRSRAAGEAPVTALRAAFLARVRARDPIAGVTDDPRTLAFRRLLVETPTLARGFAEQLLERERRLAAAFADALGEPAGGPTAAVAAAQVVGTERTLAERNLTRVLEGASMRSVTARANAEAKLAFTLLADGLAGTPLAQDGGGGGTLANVRTSTAPKRASGKR